MKPAFYPPKPNSLVIKAFKLLLPLIFKFPLSGLKVSLDENDLKILKNLRGQRMLMLPNHPTEQDPYVLIDLAKRLDEDFYCVAAREAFEMNYGLRGKIFQALGCYSLIRGAIDRESFSMTKEILVEGSRRLAIFIEGEISNQNETLIPFEPGVAQLALWAQEELVKKFGENTSPPIYLVPLAIKYKYDDGIEEKVKLSIVSLEEATGIQASQKTLYERLLTIGENILRIQEKRLNIQVKADASLNKRIQDVKEKLLSKMEFFLEIKPSTANSFLDRIRAIKKQNGQNIDGFQSFGRCRNFGL